MRKEKTFMRKVLAWMLALAMGLSIAPTTAFAAETAEPTAEVVCICTDKCTADAINENCPVCSADGVEMDSVCLGNPMSEEDEPAEDETPIGEENESVLSEELQALQERINALPTGDEYRELSAEEQDAVYETAASVSDAYFELSEEDQEKLDITKLEALFAVMNEDVGLYDTAGTVTFLNSGYPYGKDMDNSSITLVIEVDGSALSYQWQVAESKNGTFSNIDDATTGAYTFTPTSGYWYRCVVNGTASEAVMAVKPREDGRTWTDPYNSWYIGNGTMAYMANGTKFDVTGLYTKNGTNYMLQTSYSACWDLYSSGSATPEAAGYFPATATLDALRVSFDARDDYAVIFEADLADGQQAFSFGCDTQLGDGSTSGSYSDSAALNAMVKNGVLQQIAMIGAGTVEGAADDDPAFVIAPISPVSKFWIGGYSSRKAYDYNTGVTGYGVKASETIDGQSVVTLLEGVDSGMTMSWMNIPSGGSVKFQFSVGDVAHTGAVSGKVNYEKETLTGLEPAVTYIISYTNEEGIEETYTVTADVNGEIPLSGTDDDGSSYDFTGKMLTIAKQGSEDAPAEIEIAPRPDTPDNPSNLGEGDDTTPTVDANIEIAELTTTSVTISPKEGQQYAYSTDGSNWTTVSGTDGNGNYVIDGLDEGSKVYIRTRVAATSETPASQWSEPTEVQLKSTVKASATGWSGSYDKAAHSITVNVTSPAEGATITYSSTEDEGYSATNPAFVTAGEYKVYYRVVADGYYPAYGFATVTISPKEVALAWSNTEFTYNGSVQTPVATVTEDSLCPGDTCVVSVTGGAKNYSSSAYTATAIGLSNPNYKLSDTASDNKTTFKIYPKKITAAMVTADTSYVYTGSDISPQIAVEAKLVNEAGESEPKILAKGSDYTLSGDVSGKDVKSDYKVIVEGTGNYTGTVEVAYRITDSQPPTGTIEVSTNSWKELLSGLNFGIFYKERQTVKITAEDEGSGVDKIYYFLTSSDQEMDQETLAALPDSKWKEIANGGTFTIDPDNKYVIYAKITDKSGNVTFISSNGIVVDKTAPAITGIENNKIYCADVTFAVSDAIDLASVKIDDIEQGSSGRYSIPASAERATHTIAAEDVTGNKTTYTITINAGGEHSFGAWTVTTAATCDEAGVEIRTCTACGLVETQDIEKIGHDFAVGENDAHFIWTAVKDANGVVSGYSATAYFVCKNDSSHTSDVKGCSVTKKVTKSATEGEVVTYTAEFLDGDNHYEDIKTTNLTNLIKLQDPDSTDGNSNIYTSTSVAEKAPETTIDDGFDTKLVKTLMSSADEANYNDPYVATDVTIYLEVQSITGAVETIEKGKVEAQMADLVTEALNTAEDVEIESGAAYVDLSMYKNVKTEKTNNNGESIETSDTTTQITDTGTEITITMAIPKDIPQVANGFTRTYNVVRVHDGNAEVLPSEQNGNQLTFKTSKFSTYAVTYVDVKNASSNSSSGSGTNYVPVKTVRIETSTKTLTKQGETLQLTVNITPRNATDQKLTWTSSDPSVATVDANGKVTAVGDGTVTITAKTSNGKTATITITVKIEQEKPDSGDIDTKLDTSFATLRLAYVSSTKTTATLSWKEIEGADGYVVYGAPCNTKGQINKVKKLAVIKNGVTTTYKDKGLKSGTYYKYVVKAYKLVDGKKVFIARSKTVHVTTAGGKYGNAKSVKVNKTSVNLTTGEKFKVKASMVKKDKTIKQHVEIRYETSNSKVATVNSNGVITAKGKGTCYIYVYAQNGVYKRIKVTVK